MLCFALPLFAQSVESLRGADEIIERANTLGSAHCDDAVNLLKAAIGRYPTYPRLYLELARWQEERGLTKAADIQDLMETLGLGVLYLPDSREIRQRVQDLLAEKFPTRLGAYGPLTLPGNPVPFAFKLSDPRLPAEQRGLQQGLLTMSPLDTGDAYTNDPKYHDAKYAQDAKYGGWTFQHMLYAYLYDRDQQSLTLQFRVIWQATPDKEEARLLLARQTAQLLVRLYGMLHAYTSATGHPGLTPRFSDDGALNVWLAEKGDAGAEAFNENIYVYSVGTPRSSAEWVRELAHELGHQVFNPVGGYDKPEWAANGRMGEGLFMRWLAMNQNAENETLPWLKSFDPAQVYLKRYQPLIRQFADLGPNSPQLRGTDETAMDDFVGMALYIEQVRGSHYLAGALDGMNTPAFAGPNGFLDSLENRVELTVQNIDAPTVTLRLRDLPPDMPFHLFLRDGAWKGEFQGQGIQAGKVKLMIDGKEAPIEGEGKFSLSAGKPGWHQLRLTLIDKIQPWAVTSVKLARQ